jgi:hypothetical protein
VGCVACTSQCKSDDWSPRDLVRLRTIPVKRRSPRLLAQPPAAHTVTNDERRRVPACDQTARQQPNPARNIPPHSAATNDCEHPVPHVGLQSCRPIRRYPHGRKKTPGDYNLSSEGPYGAKISANGRIVNQSAKLRCDCCGDRDSIANPGTGLGSDRLAPVQCEACRALGIGPRFAHRLRKSGP